MVTDENPTDPTEPTDPDMAPDLPEPELDPDMADGDDALNLTDDGTPDPGDDHLATDDAGPRGAAMPARAIDKIGAVKASTRGSIDHVLDAATAAGRPLALVWGKSSTGEHAKGYSADYMTWNQSGSGHDRAIGDYVARYVWAHRRELGVRYLIWYRRIRNVEIAGGAWRKYTGPQPHTDHVHVCRYPRAFTPRRPSDLPAVSRRLANAAILASGAPHPVTTKRLQAALIVATGAGISVDGNAGPKTRAAVVAFQRQTRAPATGILATRDLARLAVASGNFTAAA